MIRDDDPVTELDLLAYVDGHLEPARRRVVEDYLAGHPRDARRVAADLAINDGMRRIFEDFYQEATPARFTTLLKAPRQQPRRRALAAGLAAVLALSAGTAGWWVGSSQPFGGAPTKQRMAAQEEGRQGLRRLAASVSEGVRVPDLSAAGFRLIGQTLVGNPDRPTLQIAYADAAGQRIDLFLQARSEQAQFHYEQSQQRGLLSWSDGPIVYVLTGNLPAETLRVLGEAVHRSRPKSAPARAEGQGPANRAILPVASDSAQ